tara:strand:+ start:297 stop:779 length:483 start_codon:yes stop_codon:yes gene_type:complete
MSGEVCAWLSTDFLFWGMEKSSSIAASVREGLGWPTLITSGNRNFLVGIPGDLAETEILGRFGGLGLGLPDNYRLFRVQESVLGAIQFSQYRAVFRIRGSPGSVRAIFHVLRDDPRLGGVYLCGDACITFTNCQGDDLDLMRLLRRSTRGVESVACDLVL